MKIDIKIVKEKLNSTKECFEQKARTQGVIGDYQTAASYVYIASGIELAIVNIEQLEHVIKLEGE
jgi:hypothetical protein